MMKKWMAALFTALALALLPAQAFAAEVTWEDAEPLTIYALSIVSVLALVYFIYSMIRNV